MESKYLHKSVTFSKEKEMELWEWLRKIGHGDFNRKTKEYWLGVMEGEKSEKK